MQINCNSVSHEKPSAVKKLLKPHKNVLQLLVERNGKNMAGSTNHHTGQSMMLAAQDEWSEESVGGGGGGSKRSSVALSSNSTPTYKRRSHVLPETLTQNSPGERRGTAYAHSRTGHHYVTTRVPHVYHREKGAACSIGVPP